jgi:DNA-binding MarR family transcriptional regulator
MPYSRQLTSNDLFSMRPLRAMPGEWYFNAIAAESSVARADSINTFKLQLVGAVDKGDWKQFSLARERLVELVLSAARDGDDASLKDIAALFARGHAAMVFRHDIDPALNKAAAAWMMRADATVAETARRFVSKPSALPEELRGTRDRILLALHETNRSSLSTRALAEHCRAREETVSRVMPDLRSDGLVTTTTAGRHRLHALTLKGRKRAAELRDVEARPNSQVLRDKRNAKAAMEAESPKVTSWPLEDWTRRQDLMHSDTHARTLVKQRPIANVTASVPAKIVSEELQLKPVKTISGEAVF